MLKNCKYCEGDFKTFKHWEQYCQKCFFSLMEKKRCMYCRNLFWGESWKSLCRKCCINGSKDNEKLNLDITKVNELSPDRIKALIKLIHKDRHQGALAQLAHDTTCWLLELRERQQEGQAA